MQIHRFTSLPQRSRSVINSLIKQHISSDDCCNPSPGERLAALPPAFGTIWQSRGDILRFLRTGDEETAHHLRRRFGLGAQLSDAHPIPPSLFDGRLPEQPTPPATIIIPVFNAFEHISRLLAHLPDTVASNQVVLVVDDGSDDPRIAPLLSQFASRHSHVQVLTCAKNAGFVAAANAAFDSIDPDHHAILLNSDTLPPENWVPRLLAPIAADQGIASVTPMSNTGEILSIPRASVPTKLSRELVTQLDAIAQRLQPRSEELPTGIGFCMALNRRFLDRIGGFDPVFGRGYGEEVDWCLRARTAGGRNVVANTLFVGHEGGASFGEDNRASQVARAGRRIAERHPDYPSAALAWEGRDGIGPERLALAVGWAATQAEGPVPIFIAHSLGGGAETALQQEIARAHVNGSTVIVLRAGGPAKWRVEVVGSRFTVSGDVEETTLLEKLLVPIERRTVVYSCAVHAADPASLPDTILRLARGQRLEMRIHDFFPISPSWNLIDSKGQYSGVPSPDCTDPAHSLPSLGTRKGVTHRVWRRGWSRVVSAADEITVFAPSGAELFQAAYPQACGKIVIRPHALSGLPGRLRADGQTIGVLGGINLPKGGAVLQGLAKTTSRRIAVIGEMDGRYCLPPPHVVHGRYERSDITRLAKRYDVGVWFTPSICPETFSFATHEALATTRPVVCFNLGAQGDTVRAASNGHVLDCAPDDFSGIGAAIDALLTGKR